MINKKPNGGDLTLIELHVLSAAHNLRGEGYGVSIRELINKKAGYTPSYAALYGALERMEKRGLVESRMGDATAERGGKRKKLYSVTGSGIRSLSVTINAMNQLAGDIPQGVFDSHIFKQFQPKGYIQ